VALPVPYATGDDPPAMWANPRYERTWICAAVGQLQTHALQQTSAWHLPATRGADVAFYPSCQRGAARAQAYPSRPVRIVVGFPADGGIDIVVPDGTIALGAAWPAICYRQQAGWRPQYRHRGGRARATGSSRKTPQALLQRSKLSLFKSGRARDDHRHLHASGTPFVSGQDGRYVASAAQHHPTATEREGAL